MEFHHLPSYRSKLFYRLAADFLPADDQGVRKYYSLQYKCWPPPLFIPVLTIVHVSFFLYYMLSNDMPHTNAPVPIDSALVFRSDLKHEAWRFLLYSLIHAGWWHLSFNLLVQLLIGVPLEMVHGSVRVITIYVAGVMAGSLATSMLDPNVYLVGASGGVYALLAAHVANVLLNYSQIDCGFIWLLTSVAIASIDVGFAIWDRYVRTDPFDHPVSYLAHLAGASAGLCVGFLLLRQFDEKTKYNDVVWWLALLFYTSFMVAAIVWNMFMP